MTELPIGTVTFLFTDIEGSTRLLQRLGDGFGDVMDRHGTILRDAIAVGGGLEVNTEGDAFFAVFPTSDGAVAAAVHAQRALAAHGWPDGHAVRVRMGLHTGEGVLGGDNYIGLDVHLTARIAAAGHGGQVLVSEAAHALVRDALPGGVSVRDLGRHRLKDIERPEHLYDLVIDGLDTEFPAIRTLDARPTNLPPQRTSFVGREREVAEVTALLADSRLLTLTGPGGTGKTRLALKVAADHLDRFSDGVFFADLSPVADPALVPSAIAQALLVRGEAGTELLETLADHLRDRQVLLVIDNSERVIEAGLAVARLLDAAPKLTVLATSRVPFRLSVERTYQVQPLEVPDPARATDVDLVAGSAAVALFAERAAAAQPGFQVTSDNASVVAGIASRLDGLPLAIELAASRLKILSPEHLLARLGQRLSILSGGARDLPEHQRTLRGTIEWSHDLLGPEEQRLLARLAVFSGGWTIEATEAVCEPGLELDVVDGLGSLVDQSLVRRIEAADGDARFTMLDTIKEFATERLAASGDEAETRDRHLDYFRTVVEDAEPRLVAAQARFLTRLELEHDNLRAALDWATQGGNVRNGLRAAAAFWRFWQQRGHLTEGRGRLEGLLSAPGAEPRDAVRARALGALGSIAYWQNDYEPTRVAYEEAVDIAREVDDPGLLASSLVNLAFVPSLAGDFDRASSILREALGAARDADEPSITADIWLSLGFIEVFRGNPAGALEPMRTRIGILRQQGEELAVADCLTGLGAVYRMLGDRDAARVHYREALEIFARVESTLNIPTALTGLALLANDAGHGERAARLVGASDRIREEYGGGAPIELIGKLGDPAADARAALGDEAFERAHAEGRSLDVGAVVAYALDDGAMTDA